MLYQPLEQDEAGKGLNYRNVVFSSQICRAMASVMESVRRKARHLCEGTRSQQSFEVLVLVDNSGSMRWKEVRSSCCRPCSRSHYRWVHTRFTWLCISCPLPGALEMYLSLAGFFLNLATFAALQLSHRVQLECPSTAPCSMQRLSVRCVVG